MAIVRHLGFRNFEKFHILLRYADVTIFTLEAVRHLEFAMTS